MIIGQVAPILPLHIMYIYSIILKLDYISSEKNSNTR